MQPDIRYARSGGVAIAYQVVGDGDIDLVYVPDYCSNLVYGWESAYWRRFYERLARSFRVILFDKRSTGLSDYGGQFPVLETRMDDVRAVLDAVGSSAAVLLGSHDGCSMAMLFAATYPERTRALGLFHPVASIPESEFKNSDVALAKLREGWGTQQYTDEMLTWNSPSLLESEEDRLWMANWTRVGASPAVAQAINRTWRETDVRDILPAVRVPTIVFYRQCWYEPYARDVVSRIRSARAVQVSGRDPWGIFLSPELPEELDRFIAGEAGITVPDTVLVTLLFTDIVDSTLRAAELGDRDWRELLKKHHALVRRELLAFRGEEKDTAGDGFFATFDGPARAIRCAHAVVDGVRELGIEVRAGIHTGECEVHEGKVAGIAVSIGARVMSHARQGEVLVSQTVRDLVSGSGLSFTERGEHELKGVPGTWRLYAVLDAPQNRGS